MKMIDRSRYTSNYRAITIKTHPFPSKYASEIQKRPREIERAHAFPVGVLRLVFLVHNFYPIIETVDGRISLFPSSLQHQKSHQVTHCHGSRTFEIPRTSASSLVLLIPRRRFSSLLRRPVSHVLQFSQAQTDEILQGKLEGTHGRR